MGLFQPRRPTTNILPASLGGFSKAHTQTHSMSQMEGIFKVTAFHIHYFETKYAVYKPYSVFGNEKALNNTIFVAGQQILALF